MAEPWIWKSAVDESELASQVESLAKDGRFSKNFFWIHHAHKDIFQGDVLRMPSRLPFLNAEGKPQAESNDRLFWLMLGNTCDLSRSIEDCRYVAMAPIIQDLDLTRNLHAHKTYSLSRFFYLPAWPGSQVDHQLADFTRLVHIDRTALHKATVVGRLNRQSWYLLNLCLVRFFTRSDRRDEPGQ